ncbi:MAG TPA: OmpA family protein [Myxococcota bacterium]|nr:OmpA family protein [Myxococcota bacterium]
MKPSTRSSSRPARSKLCFAPRALITLAAGALAFGCVSSSKHNEVVEERDLLRTKAARLEQSNESLDNERVALIAQLEELRQAKEGLDASVAELAERKEQLEIDLAKTSQALEKRTHEVDELRSTYDGLVNDLQSEVAAGRVQIEQLRDGLHVKLAQEILFPSGSAELSGEGQRVLGKVAGRLVEVEHQIEVAGHTDNVQISGALAQRYPSNWELAGARAAVVVRLLTRNGIPPERLVAASFADTKPVESNKTPEGRARNRRIDIRLIPPTAPGPPPTQAEAAPAT